MRKFVLIAAMVLVSATAYAGEQQRGLALAWGDEPASSGETISAETTTAQPPKFVERPAAVDTNAAQPAVQGPPAPANAQAPSAAPKDVATTEKPKRRHQSMETRVISELHRHGIYW